MAGIEYGDAGGKIDVAPAVDIPELGVLGLDHVDALGCPRRPATAAALRALSSADFDIRVPFKMRSSIPGTVSLARNFEQNGTMSGRMSLRLEHRAAAALSTCGSMRVTLDGRVDQDDRVAVEAPLEFLLHHPALGRSPFIRHHHAHARRRRVRLPRGSYTAKASSIKPSDIDAIESSTRRPNVVNVRLQPSVKSMPQYAIAAFFSRFELRSMRHHGSRCSHRPRRRHAYPRHRHVDFSLLLRLPEAHARGAVEIRRYGRHPRLRAVRFFGELCSTWPRMWAGITPSTSWWARI